MIVYIVMIVCRYESAVCLQTPGYWLNHHWHRIFHCFRSHLHLLLHWQYLWNHWNSYYHCWLNDHLHFYYRSGWYCTAVETSTGDCEFIFLYSLFMTFTDVVASVHHCFCIIFTQHAVLQIVIILILCGGGAYSIVVRDSIGPALQNRYEVELDEAINAYRVNTTSPDFDNSVNTAINQLQNQVKTCTVYILHMTDCTFRLNDNL